MTDPTPILDALPISHHVTGWTIAQLADWCTRHGIPLTAVMVDYAGCGSHTVAISPTGPPSGPPGWLYLKDHHNGPAADV